MLLLIDKMSWHYRKTTTVFIRENIRFREFEIRIVRSEISFFLISRIKSWTKRYNVWKIHMTQLKRVHKKIRIARFAQQKLWIVEKIRDVFWRWINSFKHRRFDLLTNTTWLISFRRRNKWKKCERSSIWSRWNFEFLSRDENKSRRRKKDRDERENEKKEKKIRNWRLFVGRRSRKSKKLRLRVANANEWRSTKKKKVMSRRMIMKIVIKVRIM